MVKITDPGYSLPVIYATGFEKILNTGATSPLLITGRDDNTFKLLEYVLKPSSFPNMSVQSSLRELLSSFIALELGLHIPEPALVEINNDFISLFENDTLNDSLRNSIGMNFGCKFIGGGFSTFLPFQQISDETILQKLHKIFIFDMFISNADRNIKKPNILTNGDIFYVIDHEKAFSNTMLVGIERNNYWELSELDLNFLVKKHLFYYTLKKKLITNDKFIESLAKLDNRFWKKAEELIPTLWISEQYFIIKEMLANIINNLDSYKMEIRRILEC